MKKLFIYWFLAMIGFSSCDSKNFYEKYIDNERITWNRFDVKTFSIKIKDVSATYDFYAAIRHHPEVTFLQISIKFTLYTPSGETRIMEQRIDLRDMGGKLLGTNMGDRWEVVQLIRKDFKFTEPGICTAEISSNMSLADLPGIMQVGLIVRKSF